MAIRLADDTDLQALFAKLNVDKPGAAIMVKKGKRHLFLLRNLRTPAANILKQDALSMGAELAVPMGACSCATERVDGVLICTQKQLELLVKKEMAQPFGLKEVARELKAFVSLPSFPVRIMGILNINEDSFYSGSRTGESAFLERAERMIADGADIIDVGAVSSRPGSQPVPVKEELARVTPVADLVKKHKLYEKALFSLDSYQPEVLRYALDHGFGLVNDITGLTDDLVCKVAAEYDAQTCIMHMKGTPQSMQADPQYGNVVEELTTFFRQRIEKAESFGVKKLILDTGIGFGKALDHNLQLIKHQGHFRSLDFPLLVGASRKSMIDKIVSCPTEERLPGTLAIHLKALEEGASIIRCHDVKEHVQAIRVWEAMKNAF